MTEQGTPVLLTEEQVRGLGLLSPDERVRYFHERNLIAPEPNTLEEHATELVREYLETTMGAHDLALAALRRGKELGQAAARPLTDAILDEAERQARTMLGKADKSYAREVACRAVALVSQMEGRDG